MAGVVVCHGSATVRERLVVTSIGVPSLAPVRAAASADELIALARRIAPTVVLLDAHLPGAGPAEAIRRLRSVAPSAAVVLLAGPEDGEALDRALALGARGFLAPDVGRAELAAVAAHVQASPVTSVPGGQQAVPHPASPLQEPHAARSDAGVAARTAEPTPVLTKREIEVLVGMSHGRSNAQIGQELFLSEDTVKTHARRLFRKLGASDRAQAVAIGLRRGIID
ncbi:response regulator transcription factor [Cellulomonas sp. zg-ZUI222]|uniref:Response regulator transcription factor n=1 Tax=Cellulomonas wangleii TaxID=2816956 RepID=A0ABX8D1Q0_9CELL|nr:MULTISPECIES: response regulator transcription factor [Cellulomonas]MBO0899707.1 response regulator transcription factor [Cellulomonas sp. zg-ZUI22]MBO0920569.1 response regulator transcription factor [Cellulomonas wangleii]MBO0923013.1 response regulator transcription factor [Cellulomonas wangleii]QVI61400.1 response regulator transcription factor [Cellulomonas wangleii]